MAEQQTDDVATDAVATGEVLKVRRKALGWARAELARRAALDGRIVQLVELGQWSEGDAIGRIRAVLLRAEGGELDVQLDPIVIPEGARKV